MKFFEHGPTKPVDETDKKLNTLGFALYDLIHITCAIIELVFIIAEQRRNTAMKNWSSKWPMNSPS
jgi:hypothetical protein